MNSKKNNIFIIAVIMLLLYSCERPKEFIIDLQNSDTFIAISSLFMQGEPLKLSLRKSISIHSNIDTYDYEVENGINDAIIRLYKNNELVETYTDTVQRGNYTLDHIVEVADYKIEIDIEGYNTITANNKVPTPVTIDSISYSKTNYNNQEGIDVILNFTDPQTIDNFYRLKLEKKKSGNSYTTFHGFYNTDPLMGEWFVYDVLDPLYNQDIKPQSENYFSDELINGKTYQYRIIIPLEDGPGSLIEAGDSLFISLFSISKDLSIYQNSLESYQKAINDEAEPVIIYSNIQNGVGLFAGSSVYRKGFQYKTNENID